MKLLANLGDAVGTLVHPDARMEPIDSAAHRHFLATRIALSLGSLALAPLCLVGAAPAAWEAGALAWLALPFVAALAVSRTGDLWTGEALSLLAWIGLGTTVTLGSGSGFGLALLLMVPIEAAAASGAAVALAGLAAAGVAAAGAGSVLAVSSGGSAPPPTPLGAAALLGALAYGGVLARAAARDRQRRRAADLETRERYRTLAGSIDDVVLRFDRTGKASHVGSAAQRLFGLAPQDLAGRGFFERLHVADRPVFLRLVAEVAAERRPGTATLRLKSGRTLPSQRGDFDEPVFVFVDLALRTLEPADAVAEDTSAPAVMGLLRDVSARVEQERLVVAAQESFDRTHAGRDIFLANVSHELRTPLNAIIGFAEMLSNEALAPADAGKRREYATIIHQSGQHLLAVVNGILDASKIESGSFDIVPEAFALGDLVELCCDMVGLKAEQTQVRLVRAVVPGAEELVGDQRACKQIVLNLLSNALKFTPTGGSVTIEARPEGNSVLIAVSDTGIGISARDLPRLGDPFFQARASYDRPNDGTGLGLSVVRGLVGLHGGSISIESAPGQGTRVSVRLPLDCRRNPAGRTGVTKIETISRYSSAIRHDGVSCGGRMQKIA